MLMMVVKKYIVCNASKFTEIELSKRKRALEESRIAFFTKVKTDKGANFESGLWKYLQGNPNVTLTAAVLIKAAGEGT